MNFWFIRQPCFIILSLFPQNISILTESSKSSAEVAKNDLGTKNKNTSQESDQTDEYSGWFYISCPVIWKSLFRSVFVHTES